MQISAGIFHYPRTRSEPDTRHKSALLSRVRRKINELLRSFVRRSKLHGHRVYHVVIPAIVILGHGKERDGARERARKREREAGTN